MSAVGKFLGRHVFTGGVLGSFNRIRLLTRFPFVSRLALRLLRDSRVPWRTKAAVFTALALVFSPLRLRRWIPFVGQASMVVLVADVLDVFIRMAPRDVVQDCIKELGLQDKIKV